jgi:purine-nucleoside phosphorylase
LGGQKRNGDSQRKRQIINFLIFETTRHITVDNKIKAFTSLKKKEIGKKVIVTPIIYPSIFKKLIKVKEKIKRSKLGLVVLNIKEKQLTIIKTPPGSPYSSDLVKVLSLTTCQKVLFVGAIGGLDKSLRIGDVVGLSLKKISSVKSFLESEELFKKLRKRGILGIDLETQGIVKILKKSKLKARGLYIVSDLPLDYPFHKKLTSKLKTKLLKAWRKLPQMALEEIEKW